MVSEGFPYSVGKLLKKQTILSVNQTVILASVLVDKKNMVFTGCIVPYKPVLSRQTQITGHNTVKTGHNTVMIRYDKPLVL